MQYSYLQKQQIVADLEAVAGINSVVPYQGVKDLLQMDWPNGLPGVVVPTPISKDSRKVDSQHNDRVNEFTLYLVVDAGTLSTPYDVEKLVDSILNAFDNDQTLGGTSWPTIDAASTGAQTVEDGQKTYIIVPIVIKAHALIDVALITTAPTDDGTFG